MMKPFKTTGALLAIAGLAACGGAMYRPAASNFSKGLETIAPATSEGFKQYPNEVRTAYVRQQSAPGQINAGAVLCHPVYARTYHSALLRELQLASAGFSTLAGDSPTGFANLVAATAGSYAVLPGDDGQAAAPEKFKKQAREAREACVKDVHPDTLAEARRQFVPPANPDAGNESIFALAGAVISLWQIFEPLAEGGLGLIDRQRREKAIHSFLVNNADALREDLKGLRRFFLVRNDYERALAAHDYVTDFRAAQSDGTLSDEEFSKLHERASVYDALADTSMKPAFDDLDKAMERLVRVSEGELSGEDLAAAIKSFGSAAASFSKISSDIDALRGDGEENKKLKEAIKKLKESLG